MAAVVGVTPTGSTVSPRSAFTKRRLAVVELADDDEVEAILLELLHEIAIEALLQALRPEAARRCRESSCSATVTSSFRSRNPSSIVRFPRLPWRVRVEQRVTTTRRP